MVTAIKAGNNCGLMVARDSTSKLWITFLYTALHYIKLLAVTYLLCVDNHNLFWLAGKGGENKPRKATWSGGEKGERARPHQQWEAKRGEAEAADHREQVHRRFLHYFDPLLGLASMILYRIMIWDKIS